MNDLLLSLQITALGMGLVFGAILLLWLLMALLTMVTADRDGAESVSAELSASNLTGADPVSTDSDLARAAAMAVAVALAEQELSSAHPLPDPPTAIVSAWQLGMRTRQMSEKGHSGRH